MAEPTRPEASRDNMEAMPTKRDRDNLNHLLDENNERLRQAGAEMGAMRNDLARIEDRVRQLDAQLTSPSVVRRATLNQVWDRLIDAGHIDAARLVMRMLSRVVDDV